jgi:hypothetical protein
MLKMLEAKKGHYLKSKPEKVDGRREEKTRRRRSGELKRSTQTCRTRRGVFVLLDGRGSPGQANCYCRDGCCVQDQHFRV